jgi:hypothetical protein
MARKIQLGALIVGMLLVGVERFTAQAAGRTDIGAPMSESGGPFPPPARSESGGPFPPPTT